MRAAFQFQVCAFQIFPGLVLAATAHGFESCVRVRRWLEASSLFFYFHFHVQC